MTVVVISDDYDPSVDRVVTTLRARDVAVHRVNLGWFPGQLQVDAELFGDRWRGWLRTPQRETWLDDIRAVWFRSPTRFTFPPELSPAQRAHVEREARFGLGGVLASLPVLWMNNPQAEADSAYKPRQLVLASQSGFTVPRTLITNNADAVRRFAATSEHGTIIKVLASNVLDEGGQRFVAHTHRLTDSDIADLAGVEVTTHQVQDWVPKAYEARVIVVGQQIFAVSIHTADPAAYVDWRSNYDALEYKTATVPESVADSIRSFMAASGLTFSAMDFVITPGGEWVFLESNSTGHYGWLRDILGNAVSDAIADLLTQGRSR